MQRYKFSSYMKACLRNGKEGKMGKINDKMENTTSGWFFLSLFQNDIPMVSRKKEISCFTHKSIRFSLVSLDNKSTILPACFHQNLKKNVQMFYTFDRQMPITNCYFKHCIILTILILVFFIFVVLIFTF